VQAAVTGLLTDIQRERRTTMLFISHDLSVVRYLADRVVVMYLGQIMEQGDTDDIFSPPYHPYTEALLSAVPIADTSVKKKHIVLEGDLPSPMNPPSGCPFQTRCPRKIGPICETDLPPVKNLGNNHKIMCHLDDAALAAMEPIIAMPGDDNKKTGKPKVSPGRAKLAAAAAAAATLPVSRKKAAAKVANTPASKPAIRKAAKKAAKPAGPQRLKKPQGKADDLKLISGVGPKLEQTLNKLGFWHFSQIASWKKSDISIVDDELSFKGRIERDDWVKQAKALAKGGEAEYIKVFGKKPR
jgi:peptide/nickel transport system ATP-binding protein